MRSIKYFLRLLETNGDCTLKKIISSALAFLLIFNQFPISSFAGTGDQNIERDPLTGYQSVQTLDDVMSQSNKPD